MNTVTHARIRARQGDVRGAVAVLRRLLETDPAREDARALLDRLDRSAHREACPKSDAPEPGPTPAEAASLASRFRAALGGGGATGDRRAARLRAMLTRIESIRAGEPPGPGRGGPR